MQAVLIIGGGILPSYLVKEAQAMGLYTIVTGTSADAPACVLADEHYVLDPLDGDGHAKLAAGLRDAHACQLRGVCTAGADVAPTVARAAAAAGLPGIPVEVAALTHDKREVRRALCLAGLSCYQPDWLTFFQTVADPDHRLGYPCVVKPVSQRASRGLTIVQDPSMLQEACQKALAYGDTYLIEQRLVGHEHSAEVIFGEDGCPVWANIVDRPFLYDSGVALELGHINPTRLDVQTQQQILFMVLSAARALGVRWGAFKVDCMTTAEGPKILEVTARLSGGFDCQGTSPLTGRHPMRQLLQLSCGMPVEPQGVPQGYAACAAILPNKTGKVMQLPGLVGQHGEVIWCVTPGDMLETIAHNGARPGFILAHAATYHAAWDPTRDAAIILAQQIEVAHEQCPVDDPTPGVV
jgi:cysteine synthase A